MRKRLPGLMIGVLLVLAGCGGTAGHRQATPGSAGAPQGAAVIRAWATALGRGDVAAASAYFATPSRVQIQPGGPVATVRSQADARLLNMQLPCGASLLDARPVARYIDALFLLTKRPGAQCDGPGGTARVAFVITAGRITVWRRIPDEPGDAAHGAPGNQSPPPTSPQLPPTARSV